MITEADDFLKESETLAASLTDLNERDFELITQFKGWSIADVIAHLYMWNIAADMTLASPKTFQTFLAFVFTNMSEGKSHPQVQRIWLDEMQGGLQGVALFNAWREHFPIVAANYRGADADIRVKWAGPDMSAQSKIVARQMETWAHGHEVFDILGLIREESDRIRNIAHLGVTTYSWAFRNRAITPPSPKPYVRLTSPSGAVWEWNEPQDDNAVIGDAVSFCQIVTQTRNFADTPIEAIGATARQWMEIAQCFAGAPEPPPERGVRMRQVKK